MSRVVAMLSGDIEASSEISRPGYLTEWKFDDISGSFMDEIAHKGIDSSYYSLSTRTSMVVDTVHHHSSGTTPMLHDFIGDDR